MKERGEDEIKIYVRVIRVNGSIFYIYGIFRAYNYVILLAYKSKHLKYNTVLRRYDWDPHIH